MKSNPVWKSLKKWESGVEEQSGSWRWLPDKRHKMRLGDYFRFGKKSGYGQATGLVTENDTFSAGGYISW